MWSYFPCKNHLKNILSGLLIDKCNLIVSKNEITNIEVGDFSIKRSSSKKLMGINILGYSNNRQ